MNGVHDIGGMDGFGQIHRESDERVFHEDWEGRVFGMFMLGVGLPPLPLDALRHRIERPAPVPYLASSYYERWLAAFEGLLVEAGTLRREEIEARFQQFVADPALAVPHRVDPANAQNIAAAFRAGIPATREIHRNPVFAVGDKIMTRNLNPHGHTRLPRYARGKRGVILLHHGAHVFPDSNAHGGGENPQHLYTVSFVAQELWGDAAEPNDSILLDLWEPYLERDNTTPQYPV